MKNLQVIKHGTRRVLTTQQLAESYGTTSDVVTKNFNRNKERYSEDKHYFSLEGEDKRAFLNQGQFDLGLKNAKVLYLWTEKGALLHAKSLNTDKAWEVYDHLVETYFKVSENKQLSPMDQLKLQYQVLGEHEEKLNEVSEKVIYLEGAMTIDHGQAVNIKLAVDLKVRRLCCGSESNAYLNKELKSKIYRFVWKSIKEYFDVTAYHNLLRKDMEEAIKYISNLTLQGGILREVQQENSQMCLEV